MPQEFDNAGQLALVFKEQSELEGSVRFLYYWTVKGMLYWLIHALIWYRGEMLLKCSGLMVQLAWTIILYWVVMVMDWHARTTKSSYPLEKLAHLHLHYSVTNKYFSLERLVCIFLSLVALEIRYSGKLSSWPNLSFGFRNQKLQHVDKLFRISAFPARFLLVCLFVCFFFFSYNFVICPSIPDPVKCFLPFMTY